MPRVYHVTFTKTFEATILAPSEQVLNDALEECRYEIDSSWSPPDTWEFECFDPLKNPKRPLPDEVPGFDMAVIDGEIFASTETGELRERIMKLSLKAKEELDRLHLERVQLPLPFAEKGR